MSLSLFLRSFVQNPKYGHNECQKKERHNRQTTDSKESEGADQNENKEQKQKNTDQAIH